MKPIILRETCIGWPATLNINSACSASCNCPEYQGPYEPKPWPDYPKIQSLTIAGLLNGKERFDPPLRMNPIAKTAREAKPEKQMV